MKMKREFIPALKQKARKANTKLNKIQSDLSSINKDNLDLEAQLTALLKVRALKWSSNLASGQ
jgi:hypothetical protein